LTYKNPDEPDKNVTGFFKVSTGLVIFLPEITNRGFKSAAQCAIYQLK